MQSDDDAPARPPVRVRFRPAAAASGQAPMTPTGGNPSEPSYTVGYKKPPVHSRWQKGQSGNPRGPKKRVKGLNTIVREVMTAPMRIRAGGRDQVVSHAQALILKSLEAAARGDDRSIDRLLRLFAAAMPDDSGGPSTTAKEQPLTLTDEAMLAALREQLMTQSDEGHDQ